MVFGEVYDCIYDANGKGGNSPDNLTGNIHIDLGHYACYSRVYGQISQYKYSDVTYRVFLFKENKKGRNFNLCTKLETKKILRCLQKTVPFTYKFSQEQFKASSYDNSLVDYNVLTVNIKGNYTQHLWVTTMLRCFFEWPYNIAAKEACNLQSEIKEADGIDFTKENWINLYLTIAAQLGSYGLHGVVSFSGKHPKAKTYEEWRQKLVSTEGHGSVIEALKKNGGTFNIKVSKKVSIHDQATLNQGTQSRVSKYVAAYKDKLSWKK